MGSREENPKELKAPFRAEALMAGIGGRGVLFAGQLLAEAALGLYPHVVWFPSYATQVRGGPCECTTIFSEAPISSPLLLQARSVILMVSTQLKVYQPRVVPGGLLVVESAGCPESIGRDDIKVMKVPGLETSMQVGGAQAANLVLLGAFVAAAQVIPPAAIEAALQKRASSRWGDTLARNIECFRRGLQLGAAVPA